MRVAARKGAYSISRTLVFLSLLGLPVASLAQEVCNRTAQVQEEIVEAAKRCSCALVTYADLDAIGSLDLGREGIKGLKKGDFDSLVNLRFLYLQNNQLTTLPAGVFDGPTELEVLNLDASPSI